MLYSDETIGILQQRRDAAPNDDHELIYNYVRTKRRVVTNKRRYLDELNAEDLTVLKTMLQIFHGIKSVFTDEGDVCQINTNLSRETGASAALNFFDKF